MVQTTCGWVFRLRAVMVLFLIFARPISHVEILSAFAIRAYLHCTQGSPICPATNLDPRRGANQVT